MIVQRAPAALWRTFNTETAVILPSASAVRVLNEVGARIWELADGRTFGEIVDVLVNEFEAERTQIESDAQAFLSELHGRGLLEDTAQK